MNFSKIFLIGSLLVSSVSFGTEEDQRLQRLQGRKNAQKKVLHLFVMIAVARNAAGNAAAGGARDATWYAASVAAAGNARDATWYAASVATGRAAVIASTLSNLASGDAVWDAVWDAAMVAARDVISSSGKQDPKKIGKIAAEVIWKYVLEHEIEITEAIDARLNVVQTTDVTLVNWDMFLNHLVSTRLEQMIPEARQFYIEKVEEILSLFPRKIQITAIERILKSEFSSFKHMALTRLWSISAE